MSWEREPLFTKSKLYFDKAYGEERESPFFGLYCALGLELLARSAISFVSPTLLAEPDKDHQNLLHALNLGSAKSQRKSIGVVQVLSLCQRLIPDFNESNFKAAKAIINRRNEEVHSGSAAFEEYPTQQWIAGFYECCQVLAVFQEETLETLFGKDIQGEAQIILEELKDEVIGKTKTAIAAHKRVFEGKSKESQTELKENAQKESDRLAYRGYHRVICPACKSTATVFGEPYGRQIVENNEDEIIVKQPILPTKFACLACELKLTGYSSLKAADVADHFTRRNNYTPEEYYNLIHPEDEDSITERYNELHPPEDLWGWNND